jgi:hypothetical protein
LGTARYQLTGEIRRIRGFEYLLNPLLNVGDNLTRVLTKYKILAGSLLGVPTNKLRKVFSKQIRGATFAKGLFLFMQKMRDPR